jgi:hypothetical protein
MDEKRQKPRTRTFKGGRINFEAGVGVDCLVRNLSDSGACLEVESAKVKDDHFMLVIKPESVTRTCQVVWRKPQKIGVRFT